MRFSAAAISADIFRPAATRTILVALRSNLNALRILTEWMPV